MTRHNMIQEGDLIITTPASTASRSQSNPQQQMKRRSVIGQDKRAALLSVLGLPDMSRSVDEQEMIRTQHGSDGEGDADDERGSDTDNDEMGSETASPDTASTSSLTGDTATHIDLAYASTPGVRPWSPVHARLHALVSSCLDHDTSITASHDSEVFIDFLVQCLTIHPKRRITCEQAQQHPWMTKDA